MTRSDSEAPSDAASGLPRAALGELKVVALGVLAFCAVVAARQARQWRTRAAIDGPAAAVWPDWDDGSIRGAGSSGVRACDLEGLDDREDGDSQNHAGRKIRWVRTLLVAFTLLLACLLIWQFRIPSYSRDEAQKCFANAAYLRQEADACQSVLRAIVTSVPESPYAVCPQVPSAGKWAFEEEGAPRLYVWLDNLFVDVYTVMFVAIVGSSWAVLRRRISRRYVLGGLFAATVLLSILTALIDHAENFWLLAHIGTPECSYSAELAAVAKLSLVKFRLFFLNLGLVAVWLAAARWVRRSSAPS